MWKRELVIEKKKNQKKKRLVAREKINKWKDMEHHNHYK